ncbi:hypothetical protein HGRIS_001636 [Hohenbuehelia grisea]|uniref:Uncharacterized protein n=1 Tax=Hohenbuehelia grisea TaxID=104357 RepID=A0ABR3JID3_9AGAR
MILGSAFGPLALLLAIFGVVYVFRRHRDKSPKEHEPTFESAPPSTPSFITRLFPTRRHVVNTSSIDARDDEKVQQGRQSLARQRTEMQTELAQLQRSASFLTNSHDNSGSDAEGELAASLGSEPASVE